jgi:hypothetical protein
VTGELVLMDFQQLQHLVTDPAPYGPNGREVVEFLVRAHGLDAAEYYRLLGEWGVRPGPAPTRFWSRWDRLGTWVWRARHPVRFARLVQWRRALSHLPLVCTPEQRHAAQAAEALLTYRYGEHLTRAEYRSALLACLEVVSVAARALVVRDLVPPAQFRLLYSPVATILPLAPRTRTGGGPGQT